MAANDRYEPELTEEEEKEFQEWKAKNEQQVAPELELSDANEESPTGIAPQDDPVPPSDPVEFPDDEQKAPEKLSADNRFAVDLVEFRAKIHQVPEAEALVSATDESLVPFVFDERIHGTARTSLDDYEERQRNILNLGRVEYGGRKPFDYSEQRAKLGETLSGVDGVKIAKIKNQIDAQPKRESFESPEAYAAYLESHPDETKDLEAGLDIDEKIALDRMRMSDELSKLDEFRKYGGLSDSQSVRYKELQESLGLTYDGIENRVLAGRATSSFDALMYGKWNVHKTQEIGTLLSSGLIDDAQASVDKVSKMAEASRSLYEDAGGGRSGWITALQSAWAMGESVAIGTISAGTADKGYWAAQGKGEIVVQYLNNTGKKLTELSPEEISRLDAMSTAGGGLYAAVEYVGSLFGAQGRGLSDMVFSKAIRELVSSPELYKQASGNLAKYLINVGFEALEEGPQEILKNVYARLSEKGGSFYEKLGKVNSFDEFKGALSDYLSTAWADTKAGAEAVKQGIAPAAIFGGATTTAQSSVEAYESHKQSYNRFKSIRDSFGLSDEQTYAVLKESDAGGDASSVAKGFVAENRNRVNKFAYLTGEPTAPSLGFMPEYTSKKRRSALEEAAAQEQRDQAEFDASRSAIGNGTKTATEVFEALKENPNVSKTVKDTLGDLFRMYGDDLGAVPVNVSGEDMGDSPARFTKDGRIEFSSHSVNRGLLVNETASNFLHEMGHAATAGLISKAGISRTASTEEMVASVSESVATGKITSDQGNAVKALVSVFEQARPHIEGDYGANNIYEFVSEALSSESLQKKLQGVQLAEENTTLWQKVWRFVKDALGINTTIKDEALSRVFDLVKRSAEKAKELDGVNPLVAEHIKNGNRDAEALADDGWLAIASAGDIRDMAGRFLGRGETADSVVKDTLKSKYALNAPPAAQRIAKRAYAYQPRWGDYRSVVDLHTKMSWFMRQDDRTQVQNLSVMESAIRPVFGQRVADEFVGAYKDYQLGFGGALSAPSITDKQRQSWINAQKKAYKNTPLVEGAASELAYDESLFGEEEKGVLSWLPYMIPNATLNSAEKQKAMDEREALLASLRATRPQKLSNKERKKLAKLEALGSDPETIEDFWHDEDVKRIYNTRMEVEKRRADLNRRYYVEREERLDPMRPDNMDALARYYMEEAGVDYAEAAAYVSKASSGQRAEMLRILNGEPPQRARRKHIDARIYAAFDYLRNVDTPSRKSPARLSTGAVNDPFYESLADMRRIITDAERLGVALTTESQVVRFIGKGEDQALTVGEQLVLGAVRAADGTDMLRRANSVMQNAGLPAVFSRFDLEARIPRNFKFVTETISNAGINKQHKSRLIAGLQKSYDAFIESGNSVAEDKATAMDKYFDAILYAETEQEAMLSINRARAALNKKGIPFQETPDYAPETGVVLPEVKEDPDVPIEEPKIVEVSPVEFVTDSAVFSEEDEGLLAGEKPLAVEDANKAIRTLVKDKLRGRTRDSREDSKSAENILDTLIGTGWAEIDKDGAMSAEAARITDRLIAASKINKKFFDLDRSGTVGAAAGLATFHSLKDFRYFIGDVAKNTGVFSLYTAHNDLLVDVNKSNSRVDERLRDVFRLGNNALNINGGLSRLGAYIEDPKNKELSDAIADALYYDPSDTEMHQYMTGRDGKGEPVYIKRAGKSLHNDAVKRVRKISSMRGAPYKFETYQKLMENIRNELQGATLANQKVNAVIMYLRSGGEKGDNIFLHKKNKDGSLERLSVAEMDSLAGKMKTQGRSGIEKELADLSFGRTTYWMSESPGSRTQTDDIFERSAMLGASQSRENVRSREDDRANPLKSVSVVRALDWHMRRSEIAANAWRSGQSMTDALSDARISNENGIVTEISQWMRKQVGTHETSFSEQTVSGIVSGLNAIFWVPYLINNAYKYTVRNMSLQPWLAGAVIPQVSAVKAGARALYFMKTSKDSAINRYVHDELKRSEVQGMQIVRESILMQERFAGGAKGRKYGEMRSAGAVRFAKTLAKNGLTTASAYVGAFSDYLSRLMGGTTFYQHGYDQVSKFLSGEKSADRVWISLYTDVMRAEEQAYLFGLFTKAASDDKGIDGFHHMLSEYARMKNSAVNFEYRSGGKSVVEQSSASTRAALGVWRYKSGDIQMLQTTVAEPIIEGVASGDINLIRRGVGALLKTTTAKALSNIASATLIGTPIYLAMGLSGGGGDDDERSFISKAYEKITGRRIGDDQADVRASNSVLPNLLDTGGLPAFDVLESLASSAGKVSKKLMAGEAPADKDVAKLLKTSGQMVVGLPLAARVIQQYHYKADGTVPNAEYLALADFVSGLFGGDGDERFNEAMAFGDYKETEKTMIEGAAWALTGVAPQKGSIKALAGLQPDDTIVTFSDLVWAMEHFWRSTLTGKTYMPYVQQN